jgi:outer membrane protein OmpA-like peptidoglycan-associated protein
LCGHHSIELFRSFEEEKKHMYSQRTKSACLMLALACIALMPLGCKKPPAVTLACQASPPSVFAGETVTATATAGSLDIRKKINVIYGWSGDGATGTATTATVNTSTLAPGSYTVKATIKEGKAGKEGLKPGQAAECTASYTVKEFEPPTIGCTANPGTVKPGDSSTVTATAASPQGRPLTLSYSAAAGTISGSGTTATFSSTGAPTGPVGITCNVADDKNHTASASTSVTILAPYVPPIPHSEALSSISFERDKKRPTRVDNEAKAMLDAVALNMQNKPDAMLVIVGEATILEKTPPKHVHKHAKVIDIAAQRAVNIKAYLVGEKGIDASRITVATGTADSATVEEYLVPAGANFSADVQGTTPVDESAVKPEERKPLAERHHKHLAKAN